MSESRISDDKTAFYNDLWAGQWQDMERFNPTARHLEREIIRLIAEKLPLRTVMEAGCGMGVNLKPLSRRFPGVRFTGSDLSDESLRIAREYVGAPNAEYAVLDLEKGHLGRRFDLVLCSQVLEHIPDDRAALGNLAAMCGRWLLITVPSGRFDSTSELNGHCRHYGKADLLEKIAAAGFEIRHCREWGFPFHSLYKACLGLLPAEAKKTVGLGAYGPLKRGLSHLLFGLFYGNVFDRGDNIIVLAEKRER